MKSSAPSCPLTLPPYLGLQTGIQTAHMEVQTTPVSVRLQTTLVSVETQTIKVRDEMEDRRQREEEKQVSPIYPWDHMHRAAKETEEQSHKLSPLYETPTTWGLNLVSKWGLCRSEKVKVNLFKESHFGTGKASDGF